VWIERDDFAEVPPKGFFRLFPGNKVRLKYGMVVECTGCEKDADGRITAVLATRGARHQERHAGRRRRQGQGHHHLGGRCTTPCPPVRLYDRLFTDRSPMPAAATSASVLNPHSKRWCRAMWSRRWPRVQPTRFQFERHGYFVADRICTHAASRRCSTASPG
jgi:glutaminyl-tRNA synthetase